jgi:hypothetical protein
LQSQSCWTAGLTLFTVLSVCRINNIPSLGGPQAISAFPVLVVCRTNNIPSPDGLQAYIYLGISSSAVMPWHNPAVKHTDKKENQIFLIYKEIHNGAVAK